MVLIFTLSAWWHTPNLPNKFWWVRAHKVLHVTLFGLCTSTRPETRWTRWWWGTKRRFKENVLHALPLGKTMHFWQGALLLAVNSQQATAPCCNWAQMRQASCQWDNWPTVIKPVFAVVYGKQLSTSIFKSNWKETNSDNSELSIFWQLSVDAWEAWECFGMLRMS